MKKFLFTMLAMLSIGSTAYGDEVKVDDVTIPKNGKSAIIVNFNQSNKSTISGLTFKITLPEGVEFVEPANAEDVSWYATGSTFKGSVIPNIIENSSKRVLKVPMAAANPIKGSKGMVFAVKIKTSSTLTAGTTLKGTVSEVTDSPDGQTVYNLDGSEFNITVADCDVILDENSPFMPEATSDNVDILVKRTMTKDQWGTICLPFDIESAETVKSIFGSNVELADFSGYNYNSTDKTLSINFTEFDISNGFYGCNPYLIKPSKDVDNFTISATIVLIDPVVDQSSGSGTRRKTKKFIGTYCADTVVPADNLFISNGNFYYSTGTTRMKAFRCYFEFTDKIENPSTGTRAFVNGKAIGDFDDGATGIQNHYISETGRVYSVTGRYMGENVDMKSLPKGIYIVDGVKIVND